MCLPNNMSCAYMQEGGLWVNLGPLLYHWADAHTYLPGEEHSIEISLEDVLRIAQRLGFQLLQCQSVTAGYNANARFALALGCSLLGGIGMALHVL